MQSTYQLILSKFAKFSIMPIMLLHIILVAILFVITNYQAKEVKAELEKSYLVTFDKVSEKIADNIELRFEQVSLSLKQIRILAKEIFTNPHNYINSNLTLFKHKNTFKDDINGLSSIYTTDIKDLSTSDLKNLKLLSLISPLMSEVVKSNRDLISSGWINIDKKYTLTYPYIDINESSPTIDLSKYKFYSSQPIYSLNKENIFASMHFKDIIKSGEIGAFLTPIYVNNQMIGMLTLHLTIDLIAKSLSNLELPFNSYVMIVDRENRLIVSTDEMRSFNDFKVNSLYKDLLEKRKNLNSDFYKIQNLSNNNKIIFTKYLKNSDFKVIISTDRVSLFQNFDIVFEELRKIGYLGAFLFVLFFSLSLFVTIKVIKNIAKKISTPISDIVMFSNQLGVNENLQIELSPIKEFNSLQKTLMEVNVKLCDILIKDNLTGLYNRRKLLIDIDKNMKQALIVLNIAQFKHLNNVYGTEAGDFILKDVVKVLREVICKECTLYRIGGDEFAILIPFINRKDLILFVDRKEVVSLIETILYTFEKHLIDYNGFEIVVNFYMGLGFSDDNKLDLLSKADIALSESKRKRLHYSIYSDDLKTREIFEQNLFWCRKFKDSLEEDKIVAYFQPILNLKTNKVDKFEALVRLIDKDKVVTPNFFLESARNIGKLNDITKVMVQKVFEVAKIYKHFQFSINISFSDFEDKNMINYIQSMLSKYKIPPQRIVFEILETEALTDEGIALEFIKHLKEIGFQIAIDDFGSAHSNFGHILKIQTDYIKIDGSFIKNINTDDNSLKITKTIAGFSKLIETKTVAEYVSDKEILDSIRKIGINYAQGYYISKPLSKEELYAYIKKDLRID